MVYKHIVLTEKAEAAAESWESELYDHIQSGKMNVLQFLIKTRRMGADARKAALKEIRRHRIVKFYKEHCGFDMEFIEPDEDEANCLKHIEQKEISLMATYDPLALLLTILGDDERSEPMLESLLTKLLLQTDQGESSDEERGDEDFEFTDDEDVEVSEAEEDE